MTEITYSRARRRLRRNCGLMIDGKNRIMIDDPKDDGTYIVEFKTAAGEALATSVRGKTAVLKYFQERMPYGLFVPDVQG